MNIQDIEILLNLFNQQADDVREQLTNLLSIISDGKVPSEDVISGFNTNIAELRTKYNNIYKSAQAIVCLDELPAFGNNINTCVEAAKNSQFRIIKEQIKQSKSVLAKFTAVKSKLEIYTQALKPYQVAAAELLSQINESTVSDILPQIDAPRTFLAAMAFEDIAASNEGLSLLKEISQHYSLEVQTGLATRQYCCGEENDSDVALYVDSVSKEADIEKHESEILPKKNHIVIKSESRLDNVSEDENVDVYDNDHFGCGNTSLLKSDTNAISCNNNDDSKKLIECASAEIEESKSEHTILNVTNKPKSGNPSASSFRKEIVKMNKINEEVRTILPLFTNLGIMTKEQCFLFGTCMNCFNETDQDRESVNSSIEYLSLKGYLSCFEYEEEDKIISAYCLSNYCYICMKKESIAVQMKDFWSVSIGNNKFYSDSMIEKRTVVNVIGANTLLLKYIYAMKESVSEKEYTHIISSITWKDSYYQVAVHDNAIKYICHLLGPDENIVDIQSENLLICTELNPINTFHNDFVKNIFVFNKGIISRLVSKNELAAIPVSLETERETTGSVMENHEEVVEKETKKNIGLKESIDSVEYNEISHATDFNTDNDVDGNTVATTPEELLRKKTIPKDNEFYNVTFSILNKEFTTQDQLKSIILNAVLLAHGAGFEKNCSKTKLLSLQLRLATNVLIEESAYTSEVLTTAFPIIDSENKTMALAAYLFAMLVPSVPFDYGLLNQTELLFNNYEIHFFDLDAFKALFNKLLSVRNVSNTGFSPSLIALMGSDAKSEKYLSELRKLAQQHLTIQAPKTRMKALPILYNDCFGCGSDLFECMTVISENKSDNDSLSMVQMVLSDFCDIQDGTYVLNNAKIEERLNAKWSSKNGFKLAYDAYNQALKQFKIRLEVMLAWSEHISELNSNQQDLSRLSSLKNEIIDVIQNILKDNTWKKTKNANVLLWMLRYTHKYLCGELTKIEIYSDLIYTGYISVDDNGIPIIDETMADIKFYEPWRNALKHIVSQKKSADEVKSEILGDIMEPDIEESGLKDNLHQLIMLGRLLSINSEEYVITDNQIKEAVASADDRTTHFKETLELAYTYNQINETEKETLLGIMNQYKSAFYDCTDFASWRRFLEALENQIEEFANGRKKELRAKLDVRLSANHDSPLLKEADRLLEEDKNFAVTEEYITRFDSGEIELEDELDLIIHDKDYFGDFLDRKTFDELLQKCRQGKGRALKNFGWEYVEKKLSKDWTSRLREDSRIMISNWPTRKDIATAEQIMSLFRSFGFDVVKATKVTGRGEEMFQLTIKPTAKSMADYRHPISAFGTQAKPTLNVIILSGNYTERQLVDTVSSMDLRGISVVLMIDQPFDSARRRLIGEIFHTQTSGQNPFLLIDQVLFLFLAMHQETERLPALLKCTLPYTTYQPFVRDGGSTADEMFCGRSSELATIIDPNGACIVYGGRQLGKTALLERAESRCSKPENKEYAVYSTIVRMSNESEVVDTLISDIYKKTNGKIRLDKCNTLKEMCYQLSIMFKNGQIASMHLLIDEVDCFLAAISDEAYRPIQPLVDLKRETKNNFKFVLTGLHNVCRAKNATKENGIFGQLGTPLCIKPLSPTDALKLLSRPLNYLGFQIDRYPHLETILTNTNYYPGILQFFGYMLVETLTSQYSKYYRAADGNPPFTLQNEQLGAVMNSADLNKSIKDKFRLSLELDARYFMIARCIALLYHFYEEDRVAGSWLGFKVEDIREIADMYNIHCLEAESADSFVNLLDEMVEMGILSQPKSGFYRLRRSSFVDIIGENIEIIENEINNKNGEMV